METTDQEDLIDIQIMIDSEEMEVTKFLITLTKKNNKHMWEDSINIVRHTSPKMEVISP